MPRLEVILSETKEYILTTIITSSPVYYDSLIALTDKSPIEHYKQTEAVPSDNSISIDFGFPGNENLLIHSSANAAKEIYYFKITRYRKTE